MKKTLLSAATLFGLTLAGTASAQGLDFATLDADMSGEISFTELQAAMPNITEEDFNLIDADGSGGLSQAEFDALMTPPADNGTTGETMTPETPVE